MGTLEDRFLQLKGEIEELKIIQDEKKHFMLKKSEMQELSAQFEHSLKNDLIKNTSIKEFGMAGLEYLRASNDIVHKISEKASNDS